jgi:hypothetical protein
MPELPPPEPALPASVQASLHAVAEVLRDPHPLQPEAREALAALVDELGNLLAAPDAPPDALRHLAESTAHLAQAVHRGEGEGMLSAARDRLEQAILGVEAHAPVTAGVARRVLDALANIGI